MLTTLNLLIVVGIAFAILVSVGTGFEQRYVFYNTFYCDPDRCRPDRHCPPNENITFTTSQPVIPPPWDNHSLAFQEYGVWVLGAFNGTHEDRFPSSNGLIDGTCWNKNDFGNEFGSEMTFTYLEKIGPNDTTTVQLILYSGEIFTETSEMIEDDQRFLNMGAVRSYVFFGNAAWLLYPLPSYEGMSQCLQHLNAALQTHTANPSTLITKVGSVRKTTWQECRSTVTTTRATTTSTTSTTTTTTAKTDTTTMTTTSSEPTGTSSKGPGGGEGSAALITPNILSMLLSILHSFFILKFKIL